jgi:hypothetical protein
MWSETAEMIRLLALVFIAGALPAVMAHGDNDGAMDMDEHGDMGGHGGSGAQEPKPNPDLYPPTYFTHSEHVTAIYAHIAIMVIGWVFMLPTGMGTFVYAHRDVRLPLTYML